MEQKLNFKKKPYFYKGEIYSICLRGARKYDASKPLLLYTPEFQEFPERTASIVSQKQFRFHDLKDSDCVDNYDEGIETLGDLSIAMQNVYSDFEDREIITILRFKIES